MFWRQHMSRSDHDLNMMLCDGKKEHPTYLLSFNHCIVFGSD